MNKKITSLLLGTTIAFTSMSSVLAANFDLTIKETGEVKNAEVWPFDEDLMVDMAFNGEKYLVEYEGKNYRVNEAMEAMGKDKELGEIVDQLTPVEDVEEEGELKVLSISAINAKGIVVNFNKPVAYDTAIKLENYIVTKNTVKEGYNQKSDGGSHTLADSTLIENIYIMDDQKTVIFEMEDGLTLDNGDKYSIDVTTGVKDIEGNPVERYGDTQRTFNDHEAPVIKEMKLDENKEILEIFYNEPVYLDLGNQEVKEKYALTIDGKELTLTEATGSLVNAGDVKSENILVPNRDSKAIDQNGQVVPNTNLYSHVEYKVSVKLDKDANKEFFTKGNHSVVVYNSRDIVINNGNGGNKVQLSKGKYSVEEGVETPIEVKEIKPLDFNSLSVRFNKKPAYAKVIIKKGDTVFFEEDILSPVETDGVESTIDTIYKLNLPYTVQSKTQGLTPLYKTGEESVDVRVIVEEYNDEEKNYGEKFESNLTLKRDDIKPAVLKGTVNKTAKKLELNLNGAKLDKDITTLKLDKNKVRVLDKDGINRTIGSANINAANDKVEIEIAQMNNVIGSDGKLITDEGEAYEFLAPYKVIFMDNAFEVKTDQIDVISEKLDGSGDYAKGDTTATLYSEEHEVVVNKKDDGTQGPGQASKFIEGVEKVEGPKDVASIINPLTGNNFTENENGIVITYKQAMNSKTAGNIDNYRLDGEKFPKGTYISIDGNSKVVTIILPKESFETDKDLKLTVTKEVRTAKNEIIVNNVAHNEHEYMSPVFTVVDNVSPTMIEGKSVVKDANEKLTKLIEIKLSEEIDALNADVKDTLEFIPANGTKAIAVKNVEIKQDSEGKDTILRVELEDTINVNNGGTLKVKAVDDEDKYIRDTSGNLLDKDAKIAVVGKEVDSSISAPITQGEVDAEAAKITKAAIETTPLVTGDNVLTKAQALVDAGYTVTLVNSANTAIDSDGVVTQEANSGADVTGDVTFKVAKDGLEKEIIVSLEVKKEI